MTHDTENFLPPPPANYRLGDAPTYEAALIESEAPEPETAEAYVDRWTGGEEYRQQFERKD